MLLPFVSRSLWLGHRCRLRLALFGSEQTSHATLPEHLQGADAFTENIGYTETRRYVRKVLGYLMHYRSVYQMP